MNYLGHLYFSEEDPQLMVANLFGDFVKGRDYSYLPGIVQKGVLLHRQIDDYIDHHPAVTELRLQLYKELPKIAGIAIDLYFDHLLAKKWNQYHSQPLDDFIDVFTQYVIDTHNLKFKNPKYDYPSDFLKLLDLIVKHNLLKRYKHIEGLTMASTGLSRRISFENNLDKATEVFVSNEKMIVHIFEIYMNDANLKFKSS